MGAQGFEPCRGCSKPSSWLVRDVPFPHGDVVGCVEAGDGFTEGGVVGFDYVAQGSEVDLGSVAEGGHRGEAYRGEEGVIQLVPWVGAGRLLRGHR